MVRGFAALEVVCACARRHLKCGEGGVFPVEVILPAHAAPARRVLPHAWRSRMRLRCTPKISMPTTTSAVRPGSPDAGAEQAESRGVAHGLRRCGYSRKCAEARGGSPVAGMDSARARGSVKRRRVSVCRLSAAEVFAFQFAPPFCPPTQW